MSSRRQLDLPPYPDAASDEFWVGAMPIALRRRLLQLSVLCPDVQLPEPEGVEKDNRYLTDGLRAKAFIDAKLLPAHPRNARALSLAWLEQVIALNLPRCTATASVPPSPPSATQSASLSTASFSVTVSSQTRSRAPAQGTAVLGEAAPRSSLRPAAESPSSRSALPPASSPSLVAIPIRSAPLPTTSARDDTAQQAMVLFRPATARSQHHTPPSIATSPLSLPSAASSQRTTISQPAAAVLSHSASSSSPHLSQPPSPRLRADPSRRDSHKRPRRLRGSDGKEATSDDDGHDEREERERDEEKESRFKARAVAESVYAQLVQWRAGLADDHRRLAGDWAELRTEQDKARVREEERDRAIEAQQTQLQTAIDQAKSAKARAMAALDGVHGTLAEVTEEQKMQWLGSQEARLRLQPYLDAQQLQHQQTTSRLTQALAASKDVIAGLLADKAELSQRLSVGSARWEAETAEMQSRIDSTQKLTETQGKTIESQGGIIQSLRRELRSANGAVAAKAVEQL